MNRHPEQWRHLARVTLEFVTPFRVGAGKGTVEADLVPLVEANGLPTLSGASVAGVLRHGYEARWGPADAQALFGWGGDTAEGSRLWVTWGHIHGSDDQPVEGVRFSGIRADPVLEDALCPTVRDHVRIDHRGGPARHGKFEEAVVSAGHRFTLDLAVEGGEGAREHLERLLGLLASGALRLGGSTRRGLGAFRLARAAVASCNLARADGLDRYRGWPVRLDQPPADAEVWSAPAAPAAHRRLEVRIEPEGYWAVHGSDPWVLDGEDKAPDLNPVRDDRVVWHAGRGRVERDRFYLPGSSVKGALAHRVAFYGNLLAGRFEDRVDDLSGCVGEANPEVRYLFGAAKGPDGAESGGRAGRVFIDDVWLSDDCRRRLQRIPHISVDRFTGGVRDGFLMEERVFHRTGPMTLVLSFSDLPDVGDGVRTRALEALRRALEDLSDGQLPLGAGASRGNGSFRAAEGYDLATIWRQTFGAEETVP